MHTLTYTTPDGATHTRRTTADYGFVSVCRASTGAYVVTGWHTKAPARPKNEGGYLTPVGVFPIPVAEAKAAKAKAWPAIECGRCGKVHTTLRCDGCGF